MLQDQKDGLCTLIYEIDTKTRLGQQLCVDLNSSSLIIEELIQYCEKKEIQYEDLFNYPEVLFVSVCVLHLLITTCDPEKKRIHLLQLDVLFEFFVDNNSESSNDLFINEAYEVFKNSPYRLHHLEKQILCEYGDWSKRSKFYRQRQLLCLTPNDAVQNLEVIVLGKSFKVPEGYSQRSEIETYFASMRGARFLIGNKEAVVLRDGKYTMHTVLHEINHTHQVGYGACIFTSLNEWFTDILTGDSHKKFSYQLFNHVFSLIDMGEYRSKMRDIYLDNGHTRIQFLSHIAGTYGIEFLIKLAFCSFDLEKQLDRYDKHRDYLYPIKEVYKTILLQKGNDFLQKPWHKKPLEFPLWYGLKWLEYHWLIL